MIAVYIKVCCLVFRGLWYLCGRLSLYLTGRIKSQTLEVSETEVRRHFEVLKSPLHGNFFKQAKFADLVLGP